MSEVYFYHLTRSGRSETLLTLVEKSRAAGWRVLLRGGSAEVRAALDDFLWQGREESFLPHGRAGGPHDARQPVLIAAPGTAATGFDALICHAGEAVAAEEVAGLSRTALVFDGGNETELSAARTLWKDLRAAGVAAKYWSEESGRWALRA